MRIRTFIKWAYRRFKRQPFTSREMLKDHAYYTTRYTAGSVYTAVHKSWKMGLLSREKLRGHRYQYHITDWGRRYVEEGELFREYEIRLMLLDYILRYGPEEDLLWAEGILAPKLLQRFLPGRQAMDIEPIADLHEAVDNYPRTLRMRIQNDVFEEHGELFEDCLIDVEALFSIDDLMRKIHPDIHEPLDLEKFERLTEETINKSINEIRNPRRYTEIYGYGQDEKRPIRLKKRYVTRPNKEDRIRLESLIERLEALRD